MSAGPCPPSELWNQQGHSVCVPSVSLGPALAAVRADVAAQVPWVPVAEPSLPGCRREGCTGSPSPARVQEGKWVGSPVPDAGRRRIPSSCPGCRTGVTRSCSPCQAAGWGGAEELQVWDCNSCFRGKKGESGKCPFCAIGILWSH